MHKRFPNIHLTLGGPDTVRKHLAKAFNQVWTKDIEGGFLQKLWESMPRRVAVRYIESRHHS